MTSPRLASSLLVTALIRRAQAEGGNAAILAKGDATAGGVIVILAQRGEITDIFERGHDFDGRPDWRRFPANILQNHGKNEDYLAGRRARDPDLWAVELDIADCERFAAEMTAMG